MSTDVLSDCDFKTPAKRAKQNLVNRTPDTSILGKKLKSMSIPPSPFLTKLGYGTGVNVYLMDRPGTPSGQAKSPWAVKKINKRLKSNSLKTFEQRLAHEAEILKKIKHENIIGYRDTLRSSDGSLCLCMESGERSLNDLLEFRKENGEGLLDSEAIFKAALGVSQALSYLHNDQKLLHGDIKSHNVLIKGNFDEVKLCDFGVCLKLKDDLSGLKNEEDMYCGTGPWTCMEALSDGVITDKADVYSFGCLLFEMLTLNVPHMPLLDGDADSFDDDADSFDEDAFLEAQGSVPILPELDYGDQYFPFIALMTRCCDEEAQLRPSAREIVTILKSLQIQP